MSFTNQVEGEQFGIFNLLLVNLVVSEVILVVDCCSC